MCCRRFGQWALMANIKVKVLSLWSLWSLMQLFQWFSEVPTVWLWGSRIALHSNWQCKPTVSKSWYVKAMAQVCRRSKPVRIQRTSGRWFTPWLMDVWCSLERTVALNRTKIVWGTWGPGGWRKMMVDDVWDNKIWYDAMRWNGMRLMGVMRWEEMRRDEIWWDTHDMRWIELRHCDETRGETRCDGK